MHSQIHCVASAVDVESVMKTTYHIFALVGLLTTGAIAGDWGKAPIPKAPIEECYDLGGSISTGYATDFVFQGARHARDTVWVDTNYTFSNLALPVTLGATYYNFTEGSFANGIFDDFLHVYAKANTGTHAGFDTALSYNHVFFPEGSSISSQAVIMFDVRRSLGIVDFVGGTSYSAGGTISGGWYHHAGLEKTFEISDTMSLVVGGGAGYSDNYWVHLLNTGWAHYYAKASLPIQLNCRTTLTPYIGYNGGINAEFNSADTLFSAGGGDVLHGGVSLSVSF